ncbi:hypothetical protein BDA96_05G026400 [Sorghum bicolor]|uniref:Uncharacterized protein n=2 Tax=Sorghum bicolor TaxID=4558 RepID=A0A921UF00_SORBI|nr:tryptamine hydroxycinnamoyltransferase 1 [Sorghum bicolor]EES09214.2 hypothetical protein SORBI_3005G026300 [Sorghum bicolor]KAG0528610.1 hypothetical protein BDA96_05G026400 [Sorghum bicolor]|eukprot:XP_021316577.1 tryptamine hydroxycinnamoyltransferase 1 [Sorghum bicolor]
MDVQVQRTFVIPAPASEPSAEVPLTVFDLVAPTYHVTVLFAYTAPNPTNAALLDALAATLPRFPLLTARLVAGAGHRRRRPFFVTGKGGAGALVVEATVPSALSDHLPLAPAPELASLHVPVPAPPPQHLLMLQINRFACGGLVVATSAHHQAADGYSMSTFFHAWADAVRATNNNTGGGLLPPPAPYGPSAIVPRRPPRCEFEHRGTEFLRAEDAAAGKPAPVRVDPSEIANVLLHLPSEFVAGLKQAAATAPQQMMSRPPYTTFETVSAHLWRKITLARGRADDASRTALNAAVNGRARLAGADEAVARGFFGNVVLTASAATSARDLARGTLGDAAALVRAGVRARDRHYFQSFIDFGELHGGEELEPTVGDDDNVLLPDVASDSWLHLELHRLDFGCGGRLAGILPAKVPLDGVVVLIPSLRKGGGVDVFVALWEKHAKELMNIAYTMD